jgi:hypothetical protein
MDMIILCIKRLRMIADFKSFNSIITYVRKFSFKKKFQQLYTIAKFKEVQEEIREVMYCNIYLIKRECVICTYQMTEWVEVTDAFMKKVNFTIYCNEPCKVNCSCCLFESREILCKHVISALIRLNVTSLPEKYFLN